MFDTNGQLFFFAGLPYILNPEHPFWVPEFVGDAIVVNGKTWPYLNVEPKRYTFLFINGSNARTYEMFLLNQATGAMGPAMWQIATDGGYLDTPVKIDPNAATLPRLIMMPGERAEVIIDFSGLPAGTNLILRNIAKTPYPGGTSPQGNTLGRIMQFRVTTLSAPDTSYNPATLAPLRSPIARLVNPAAGTLAVGVVAAKTRDLTLNEIADPPVTVNGVKYPGWPREILVNNTDWTGLSMSMPTATKPAMGTPRGDLTAITVNGKTEWVSELPNEGDVEVWEIVNMTADAHPIHTHLVQFQLLNRQAYNTNTYTKAYAAAFPGGVMIPAYGPPLNYTTGNPRALGGNPDVTPFLQGPVILPNANEAGWKDTVMVPPGMVTRLVVRWAPAELATNLDPTQYTFPFDPNALGHGSVWHCHIVDHEDKEMMRADVVMPKPAAWRTYVHGVDY